MATNKTVVNWYKSNKKLLDVNGIFSEKSWLPKPTSKYKQMDIKRWNSTGNCPRRYDHC